MRSRAAGFMCLALLLASAGLAAQELATQEYELGADERRLLGPPQGVALTGGALETRAREVGSLLRCPVCQGLSVYDSPVPTARAMQAKVELLLEAGYNERQILTYFETSYGEFIRLWPKPEGFNLVVWILPLVAILVGVGLVAMRVRGAPAATDDGLDSYLSKVREEAGE